MKHQTCTLAYFRFSVYQQLNSLVPERILQKTCLEDEVYNYVRPISDAVLLDVLMSSISLRITGLKIMRTS